MKSHVHKTPSLSGAGILRLSVSTRGKCRITEHQRAARLPQHIPAGIHGRQRSLQPRPALERTSCRGRSCRGAVYVGVSVGPTEEDYHAKYPDFSQRERKGIIGARVETTAHNFLRSEQKFQITDNSRVVMAELCGIYWNNGGSVTVGTDYGIKWKKILFVSVPVGIYINSVASGSYVMDHVSYFGPYNNNINPLILSDASVYASITPALSFGPAVVAWKIFTVKVFAEAGLTSKFTVSMLSNPQELLKNGKLPFKGVGTLDATLGVFGEGTVGYDFGTILGILKVGKREIPIYRFTILGTQSQNLLKYDLF